MRKEFKMLNKFLTLWLCLGVFGVDSAYASMAEFQDVFEVNLEEDLLPTISELETAVADTDLAYDRKFRTIWQLRSDFDEEFYTQIAVYGEQEKRMKWADEDALLEMLGTLPKEMYQYIGPMLFEVPSMSDKILNLPGIKETKNKFPTRIAEQLKDVEDIEFLSPSLYFILMPEMWPDSWDRLETPKFTKYYPKIKHNPEFYVNLKKIVKPEDFMPGASLDMGVRSKLRTLKPTKDTLITAADVEAVGRTISKLENWYNSGANKYELSKISTLWANYEYSKEPHVLPMLRDMVNPCARLVQKAKILGKERELASLVASEGFTLNEWAYTCDKTIKAYRLSKISREVVQAIRTYRMGYYDEQMKMLSPKARKIRYATMQAIIKAYAAPLADVLEVRKKRDFLEQEWQKYGFDVTDVSIRIVD